LADDFGITDDLYAVRNIQKIYKTDSTDVSELVQIVLSAKTTGQNASAVKAARGYMEKTNSALTGHQSTQESSGWGSWALEKGADVGLITSYLERAAGFKGILRAAPLGASLVIMVYVAMIPIGLVIGRFSIGSTLGLTLGLMSVFFWLPYFRFVRWLDDNLVSVLDLGNFDTNKMLIDFLIAATYVAVPMVLTTIATMAGIKLASFEPLGASTIGSVAQAGAKTTQNAVKTAAKKAVTKGKG
jgi:hypothetical protein